MKNTNMGNFLIAVIMSILSYIALTHEGNPITAYWIIFVGILYTNV